MLHEHSFRLHLGREFIHSGPVSNGLSIPGLDCFFHSEGLRYTKDAIGVAIGLMITSGSFILSIRLLIQFPRLSPFTLGKEGG